MLTLALVVWVGNESSQASLQTQDADRVLEIERYPNEPLELVHVRIGPQNVKDRIKTKLKDIKSKFGIDSVKFNEKDDWFKRLSITLRNRSDKPVYGVEGFLFFKPVGFQMIFSMPLTASKELRHEPLEPGAEIELTVTQGMLNHTLEDMKFRGTDVSNAVISFSLDAVIYSDELQWYRGKLLRPDSATPGKWVPVDQPLAMKRSKSSVTTASFVPASFKAAAPLTPSAPVFATCEGNGGFITPVCSGGNNNCVQRIEFLDGFDGVLKQVQESGLCKWVGGGSSTCTTSTTHTRLETNPLCFCPEPPVEEQGYYQPGGGVECELCQDGVDNDCDTYIDQSDTGCSYCPSPVLVDVSGNGFNLTNAANGVNFDVDNDGIGERLSWTAPQTDDAWLALDRNADGLITNGAELFGNVTPQSNPPVGVGKNGFHALGEYDQLAKGGNGDGLITDRDAIFRNLLLWQDKNHNGISEANEISSLSQLGLKAIECDYGVSKRRDQYGNAFRYRAKVIDARNTRVNRWAWDVFLLRERNLVASYIQDPINRNIAKTIRGWLRE